jgi:RNA polymerase sigma factor (TIGR02999 family)
VPLGGFRESTVAEAPTEQITQLLRDWSQGDQRALDALGPLVYQYLHRIAQNHMRRERPGHTLQATALVHEAYLRPVDRRAEWKNRAHFFAIAAQMMRRILVDHAKAEHSAKRGAGAPRVSLDEPLEISREPALDLVRLNDNLAGLGVCREYVSTSLTLRWRYIEQHQNRKRESGVTSCVAFLRPQGPFSQPMHGFSLLIPLGHLQGSP